MTTTGTTTSDHAHTGDDHTHDDHARARGRMDGAYAGALEFGTLKTQGQVQGWLDEYEEGGVYVPEPLSGEWAGESLSELGMGTWDDDALQAYLDAHTDAYLDTMYRLCQVVVQQ